MNHTYKYAQFYLNNPETLRLALQEVVLTEMDTVVEIGPGQGVITSYLVKKVQTCLAYEVDINLTTTLSALEKKHPNLKIFWQDFLTSSLPETPYKIVSNIPFNLTRPIFEKIILHTQLATNITIFVQKEVAIKITKGDKGNTLLSTFINSFYHSKIIKDFSRTEFTPPAHVDVSLLQMVLKNTTTILERKNYLEFLSTVFASPNNPIKIRLKKLFTYNQIKRLSKNLKISLELPPFRISTEQYIQLFNLYNELNIPKPPI